MARILPGVINASVGFDEATLQPTYELKMGVPGASAGINIAQRLGLNPAIIDSARARLGTQARDVGEFLDGFMPSCARPKASVAGSKAREQELEREKTFLPRKARKNNRQDPRDGEEAGERCFATSNTMRAKR